MKEPMIYSSSNMDSQILLSKFDGIWQVIYSHLSDSAWLKSLQNLVAGWDWIRERSNKGLYEVIDYEATLELKDNKGQKALVSKYEKVRYLQDNVIAFQDQAWGDGRILLNYRCAPGVPVDTYRFGFKYLILISLREIKMRGDVDEFHIEWGIRQGFLKPCGFWATEISHPTEKIQLRVIFPKSRPPVSAAILEKNRQKTTFLGSNYFQNLPNGKKQLVWAINKPRLYQQYILNWEW